MDADERSARSPAEEARALMGETNVATLATLTADGDPWASLVTFGLLDDGTPVLWVSLLAEHGRNLAADPRASLAVAHVVPGGDPLATGRVTLLGRAERPEGAEAEAAGAAYRAAVPGAVTSADFHDFSLWVLRVRRARWVGGYGRMDDVSAADYAGARAG
jgi:putative heme iron utilization protein